MIALGITLRSSLLLLTYAPKFFTIAAEVQLPKSVTLSYEIIGSESAAAQPLGIIDYDASTLKSNIKSWTPPSSDPQSSPSSEPTNAKLLRILLPDGSSTITSLQTFSESLYQKIDLSLSSDGNVFSAAISPVTPPAVSPEEEEYQRRVERAKARGKPIPKRPKPEKPKKAKNKVVQEKPIIEPLQINIVRSNDGIAPKLGSRKAPQVDAEGKEVPEEQQQQEKSFLQKYWWVLLIGLMFTMMGGGDK